MRRKSKFDADAYVELAVIGPDEDCQVVLYRYQDNDPRLKVQRLIAKRNGDTKFTPLRGMNASEARAVAKLLEEGAKAFENLS